MEGRTAGLWLAAGRGAGADADAAAYVCLPFIRIPTKSSQFVYRNQPIIVSIHE